MDDATVGVRELRQNLSVWLRRVEEGESFVVTDRGRPVARLGPLGGGDAMSALVASGLVRPPEIPLADVPPPVARPDLPRLSDLILEERGER
jgi:prevent-host-death family protein